MNEDEEYRKQKEEFVNECRERIRNGERKFSQAEKVAAKLLWRVNLDKLIEEARARTQPMKRGLGLWDGD